jgi:hypothetical protein
MLSKDLERLRGKDVSQLTDLEKVKLRLAQQRLSSDSEMAERVKKLTTRGGPVPQGPTPSGGNLGDDEDLVGRALNLTKDQTQIARARRVDDTDSDERISGSSMSYGQFYNLTGRKYDAFSDLDRKIVINMAGGGKLTPGNYNPNQMSQGEAGFMTGANYAFRANERERTANAAAFRQQDAAAKQRELENTPEYKEAQRKQAAQNRANLEAEVEGDLAKEYGVDTETIRRARTAGVNPRDLANQSQQSRPSPIQQTQSVVSSFKAPAAMQNQMTQSPRTSMVPGSKSFIDAQLRKMRGI